MTTDQTAGSGSTRSGLQFVRYLLVGGFNTAFGYGIFALLNWCLTGLFPYSYMVASLLASLIGITVSFLGYKWFVFRTRGHYLAEWIRCVGVYGSTMVIGLVGLPILVTLLRPHLRHPESASYLAGAIMTGVTVIFSFVAHKNISFRATWSERR